MAAKQGSDDRKARLAAQLRANLRKRRDQARKRNAGMAGDTAVNSPQNPPKPRQ